MGVFRVTRALIGEALGLTEEVHGDSMPGAAALNQRLELIFREILCDQPRIIQVSGEDLSKLSVISEWQPKDPILYTKIEEFDAVEEGIPDRVVQLVNRGPMLLIASMEQMKRVVFCNSPRIRYSREEEQKYKFCMYLNFALAPEPKEDSHEPAELSGQEPQGGGSRDDARLPDDGRSNPGIA